MGSISPEHANETVNHPPHYTAHPSGVECIEITEHMNFNLGNAVKYIWRCDDKGDPLENIDKAIWYLAREKRRRQRAARAAAGAKVFQEFACGQAPSLRMPKNWPFLFGVDLAAGEPSVTEGCVEDVGEAQGDDLTLPDETAGVTTVGVKTEQFEQYRTDDPASEGEPEADAPTEPELEPEAAEAAEEPESESASEPATDPAPVPAEEPKSELVTGPVSEAEATVIIDLTQSGASPATIAKLLRCKPMRVSSWKKANKERLSLPPKKPKPGYLKSNGRIPKKAHPIEDWGPRPSGVIAPEGVPLRDVLSGSERAIFDDVSRLLDTDKWGWTPDRDRLLVQVMAAGDGPGRVAELLGCDKQLVLNRWKALNAQPASLSYQAAMVKVVTAIAEQEEKSE